MKQLISYRNSGFSILKFALSCRQAWPLLSTENIHMFILDEVAYKGRRAH